MARHLLPLLLVCCLISASAQTPKKKSPAPKQASLTQAYPLASVAIEGTKSYPLDAVIAASGLKIGQSVAKPDFDAARDRLIATGAFATVGYRFGPAPGNKYAVTFEVAEVEQVYPYRFEGLNLDAKAARQWMRTHEPLFVNKVPATAEVLSRLSKEMQDYLTSVNQAEPVVAKLLPNDKAELEVVFRPSRLPAIAEVDFIGNKVLMTQRLQSAVASTAVGSTYTEDRMQQILDASVRPVYEEIGKIKVSFPKMTTKPAKGVDGLVVTVTVEEGDTYKLGDVYLTGPMKQSKELIREGKFKSDEPVNFTDVKAGVDRMLAAVKRKGYIRATSTNERKIDEKEKKVDLAVNIDPGPQFMFGKLGIEGLDIISEPQIRKMWSMKPGQPYDAEYPYYFLRRMEEDNLFENLGKTSADLHIDDAQRFVDVTLHFSSNGKALPTIGPDAHRKKAPY